MQSQSQQSEVTVCLIWLTQQVQSAAPACAPSQHTNLKPHWNLVNIENIK